MEEVSAGPVCEGITLHGYQILQSLFPSFKEEAKRRQGWNVSGLSKGTRTLGFYLRRAHLGAMEEEKDKSSLLCPRTTGLCALEESWLEH
jgi:hypothetical protein